MTPLSLTQLAHEQIALRLQQGQFAIDATIGNGHDTVFLAKSIGQEGCVFGFDIQQQAITHTKRRIAEAGLENSVTLIQAGHEEMAAHIPAAVHGQIKAVMFNLGYLPGSNKSIITQPETTVMAITAATELLAQGGIMTIMVYRGHPGGLAEASAVEQALESLQGSQFEITRHISHGPWLFIIKKGGAVPN